MQYAGDAGTLSILPPRYAAVQDPRVPRHAPPLSRQPYRTPPRLLRHSCAGSTSGDTLHPLLDLQRICNTSSSVSSCSQSDRSSLPQQPSQWLTQRSHDARPQAPSTTQIPNALHHQGASDRENRPCHRILVFVTYRFVSPCTADLEDSYQATSGPSKSFSRAICTVVMQRQHNTLRLSSMTSKQYVFFLALTRAFSANLH